MLTMQQATMGCLAHQRRSSIRLAHARKEGRKGHTEIKDEAKGPGDQQADQQAARQGVRIVMVM